MKTPTKKNIFAYGCGLLFIALIAQSMPLFFGTMLAMIWFYPTKGEKQFSDRFKNIMNHKKRIFLSVIPAILFLVGIVSPPPQTSAKIIEPPKININVVEDGITKTADYKYQLAQPVSSYLLKVSAGSFTSMSVNTETAILHPVDLVREGDVFSGTISLPFPITSVFIVAHNGDKIERYSFSVERGQTAAEKEQAEKVQKEKQRIIDERAKQDAKEQAVIDKKIASLKAKYESMCKNGYLYEVESRLFKNDFQQEGSGYEKAPDGSTQIATHYSKMEGEYFIDIELQSAYDISSHWYNVHVRYYGVTPSSSQAEKDHPDYRYCMMKYKEDYDPNQKKICDRMLSYL